MKADREPPGEFAAIWQALADPTRRSILDLLRTGPRRTGDVAAEFEISRIAVMRHLASLEEAGLLTSRKRGRERWHYINLAALDGLTQRWLGPVGAGWSKRIIGFRDRVERATMELAVDIAFEISIEASPSAVFQGLARTPDAWWGPPYVRSEATGVSLDPRPGGLLIERWTDGNAVLATVTAIAPERYLQLSGPFHLGVAHGVAEFDVTPDGDRARLAFTFRAIGAVDPDLAEQFSGGFRELLGERLRRYVESGQRTSLWPAPSEDA